MADILIDNEQTKFTPLQVTKQQQSSDFSVSLEKEVFRMIATSNFNFTALQTEAATNRTTVKIDGRSDGNENAISERKSNLKLLLNFHSTTTSDDSKQKRINNYNEINNQDQSNTINHQTPTITKTTTNACQLNPSPNQPIYNEFVNHIYENSKSSNNKQHNEEDEDVKPLLKSLKSIVKSPSGNVKSTLPLGNGAIKTKNNKRLSWQALTNPARHPLRTDDTNNENTQSTSLDSSEEQQPVTQNEDCSSPIVSSTSSSSDSSSSSSSDDDEFSEIVFQAPDGGYGWVIVLVSFLINMIADGITFSFGVFNVEFLKYFGDSKGKTAWISSIFMATPLLSGPIASYLTDRYGCRKVTIFGAILSAIGFLLSSISKSMEMLFITFGLIAGFGLSLCYVAAVVIVAYYFDKKRSFATGISVCGSGIGTFLFPPLIQSLIEYYGWRGCSAILAGILLNMCVCGALMRDLEWTTHRARKARKHAKKIKQKKHSSFDSFSITASTNTNGPSTNGIEGVNVDTHFLEAVAKDDPHLFSSLINLPTFVKNGEKIPIGVLEQLAKNRNFHDVIRHNYPHLLATRSLSTSDQFPTQDHHVAGILSPTTLEISKNRKNHKHRHTIQIGESETDVTDKWLRQHNNERHHHHVMDLLKDLRIHRHSLTYRGAMLNINKYRLRASSCPDIYRNSMTTITSDSVSTARQMFVEFKKLFKDILDFSYFLDIRFLLFAISNFILYTWYDVVYVYLPDFALEQQVSETDASVLISLIGIINMFGEIILGWTGDREELNPNIVYAVCMAFCGVAVTMIPFFTTYIWMCLLSGAFGLFIAANYSLTSIILVNLVDLDRFTNAYGLLLLVQGIANLVGPPIAGMAYDFTGTYNLSFFLAGGFIILSGFLLMILPVLSRYRKFQRRRKESKISEIIVDSGIHDKTIANGVCV
ncbi:hypothetical protein PVAND_011048 [Polypedilum vanderplanki]|uniref:Major facilitator superfamily (MFS) profile domain-containing protein n=1 Tax=Polypedilum vanderplanki TaxID=319348 RepID=A0A9J6CIC9_POLVA|nr:hypothetical protein PVAND_011048 [Polypedilum vanderplanki]